MLFRTPALTALAAASVLLFAGTAAAQDSPANDGKEAAASVAAAAFNAWRDQFRARALKAGIPHDVFEKALGNVRPDPNVHEKNADQPEFTRPVWDYLDGALSGTRIENGRKMLRQHASLLADAERAHGVPRRFLVAIWGMETSYGALLGSHNIFEALATLSYQGNRKDYGEEQLLAALRLLADGHKPLEAMKGSWAGAVGHTQFVPTTYLKYAVDGDKDGRVDLWDSLSDVFHSTAHYLKKSGFDPNLKWGREAVLPDGFDYALAGDHVTKPLSEWRSLGVKMTDGALVPDMAISASILLPAGHQGPAFLIYENFQALLTYNRSISYALAIGLLSDEVQGGPSLKKSWPRHLKPLSRDERIEIQRRLAALGYEPGKADGVLGRGTRDAIRAFQKDRGEIADGYATVELLVQLRTAGPKAAVATSDAVAPSEPEEPEEISVAVPVTVGATSSDGAAASEAAASGPENAAAKTVSEAAEGLSGPADGETGNGAAGTTPASQTAGAASSTSGQGAGEVPVSAPATTEATGSSAEDTPLWEALHGAHEAAHAEHVPGIKSAAKSVAERNLQPAPAENAGAVSPPLNGAAPLPGQPDTVYVGTGEKSAGEQAKAAADGKEGKKEGPEPSDEDESNEDPEGSDLGDGAGAPDSGS